MRTNCPFCGSDQVKEIWIEENYLIPFCADAIIPHKAHSCEACGEEGDFDNTQEHELSASITEANKASAQGLMEFLVGKGITMTYLEKALRLPFRTTARWKRGEISHSALALLRLIRFSPALLEVADENFSEEAQAKYHLTQPCILFDKYLTN